MNDEQPGRCEEIEYGVRFSGIGNNGERGVFVERHSTVERARGRCAMYRGRGDEVAAVVARTVTTAWTDWEPLPHPERSE